MSANNHQLGCSPLMVVPPADRRGAQMKVPSKRAPRSKNAGGVLEHLKSISKVLDLMTEGGISDAAG